MAMSLATKQERMDYAKYLIERFGNYPSAIIAVDEILKFCPQGTNQQGLKIVKDMILEIQFNNL